MKINRKRTALHHLRWQSVSTYMNQVASTIPATRTLRTAASKEGNNTLSQKDYISIHIKEDEPCLCPDEVSISLIAANIINNIPPIPSAISFIYRVPDRLRAVNPNKYEPRIVSIGPFHQNKQNLKITARHKYWYMCDLINRSKQGTINFRDIVKAVYKLEPEARGCYGERINLNTDEFVKMMILDGCFIIELLYKYNEYKSKSKEECKEMHSSHGQNHDFIFSAAWIVCTLQRDLILLENQIPFIILQSLFKLAEFPGRPSSLNKLVLNFLDHESPTTLLQRSDRITGMHLLDLMRNYLLPSARPSKYGEFPTWNFTQYSATDLREAGVSFKEKIEATSLFDITFTSCGTLQIPRFFFGEGMTILLPNLIALEQCHRCYTDHIASYAILLDSLINTKDDVKLLRSRGIIDVTWNEDENIAAEINSMCKGVKIDEFYYDELCCKMKEYCRTNYHKWRAALRHNHFKSPWAILSLVAALVLLLLTVIQTVFPML